MLRTPASLLPASQLLRQRRSALAFEDTPEIRRREALYGEFISECSARIIDSFERTLEKPETLLHAYALLNRIRLCASDAVLAQAEATLRFITEQYFSPNLSVDEMRKLVRKWTTDPLEPFGEACRIELKSIRAAV